VIEQSKGGSSLLQAEPQKQMSRWTIRCRDDLRRDGRPFSIRSIPATSPPRRLDRKTCNLLGYCNIRGPAEMLLRRHLHELPPNLLLTRTGPFSWKDRCQRQRRDSRLLTARNTRRPIGGHSHGYVWEGGIDETKRERYDFGPTLEASEEARKLDRTPTLSNCDGGVWVRKRTQRLRD